MSVSRSLKGIEASGLPEREARIWDALSKRGASNISQISSATRLHRPAVYQLLPNLIQKKLVEKNRLRRRATYQTTGARSLEKWRADRDAAFAGRLAFLKKQEEEQMPKEIQVYRGKEIRRAWEDVVKDLPKGSVFYRYDGYHPGTSVRTYVPSSYRAALSGKALDRFVITNGALRKSQYRKRIECASRMLPASFDPFEHGVIQFITKDSIAFIDFTTEIAFIIKNNALAGYQAKLFQYLYRALPE